MFLFLETIFNQNHFLPVINLKHSAKIAFFINSKGSIYSIFGLMICIGLSFYLLFLLKIFTYFLKAM